MWGRRGKSCSGLYDEDQARVRKVGYTKATKSGTQETPEGFPDFILGPPSMDQGEGCASHRLEGHEGTVPSHPAEVGFEGQWLGLSREAIFLGLAGEASLPSSLPYMRRPMVMKMRSSSKMTVVSRVSSQLKPFLARSSCSLRRASRRARRRRSRCSCSP